MKRIVLQPAYVLHRRPYRETSFLIEFFTLEHGRLSAIARGIRKSQFSQGILQPFMPLLISVSGKGELMSLSQVEMNGETKHLRGECLFAGFYLNELLMCLLEKFDAHAALYLQYEKTLNALQGDSLQQKHLRVFEKYLLEEMGYGLLRKNDVSLQTSLLPEKYYRFVPEQGFVLSELGDLTHKANIFSGKNLLAIANEDWQEDNLQDAKRLTRLVLASLLGNKQLHSRKLFMQLEESKHE